MRLLKAIDSYLDSITMYSLMIYGLGLLLASGLLFSLLGRLPIPASHIIASSIVIITVCFIADRLLPIIFSATANKYSSLITALILCLILQPSNSIHDLALVSLGSLIAISSKYVLAIHYKHLFNPAALAALVLGLSGLLPAIWWIGSPVMLLPTLIFGLLVLRKIRRFQLFFSFLSASLIVALWLGMRHDQTLTYIISTLFKSSPLIFLGSVMLSEPSTSPPRLKQQIIYGVLVGAIFTSQLHLGSVSATPELALIVGNIYAYLVSPKYKLRLKLKLKQQLAPQVYGFHFTGAQQLNFEPGQYLEWTLPNSKSDGRGNRRVFSIASPPGEDEIHFATKFTEKGSSFKKDLLSLKPGDLIMAGQLAGDFVLPKGTAVKLAFIAGGIGITPFVSMAKTIIKDRKKRDIVLIYLISSPEDFCYQEVWQAASSFGLRVVPILSSKEPSKSWKQRTGYLTDKVLIEEVPDYIERRYYISGPPGLVSSYYRLLTSMKVKRRDIVRDHFSGY